MIKSHDGLRPNDEISTNTLSISEFKFEIPGMKHINFWVQSAELPSITPGQAKLATPFGSLSLPGQEAEYDPLNISFLVDDECNSYFELLDWLQDFRHGSASRRDGMLTLKRANGVVAREIRFRSMVITGLTNLPFASDVDNASNIVANATFSYVDYV